MLGTCSCIMLSHIYMYVRLLYTTVLSTYDMFSYSVIISEPYSRVPDGNRSWRYCAVDLSNTILYHEGNSGGSCSTTEGPGLLPEVPTSFHHFINSLYYPSPSTATSTTSLLSSADMDKLLDTWSNITELLVVQQRF